jgi:hypothetical protein
MRCLQIVKAIQLALVLEIPRGIGKGLKTLKKIPKAALQLVFERRAISADKLALRGIEASKAQAIAKAACLRALCLI